MPEIKGVEIASVGKWNGDNFKESHLDSMVQFFEDNQKGFKPPLKLGHNKNQKLVQKDGLPAAGFIQRVYRKGEKLLADFVDIPQKIYELIQKNAYRHVSPEIFFDLEVGDKKYSRALAAVALLGADNPAMMNLNSILNLYGIKNCASLKTYTSQDESLTGKTYSKELENLGDLDMPTEKEIELQKQLDEQKKNFEAQSKKYSALEQEQKDRDAELAKLRQENEKNLAEKLDSDVKAFVTELQSEKLISKAMEPMVYALMRKEQKEYSLKNKDDSEKKYSKKELFKSILKLAGEAAKVNFSENSVDGEKQEKGMSKEDKIDREIKAYAAEHKVEYRDAYSIVMKKYENESDTDNGDDE